MNSSSPLLVPMTVEAMVVNDGVRLSGALKFYRTRMNYKSMAFYESGQLVQMDSNFTQGGEQNSQYYNGVYLKWRLPDAFARAGQIGDNNDTTFPPAPNRWLVIRYSGPPQSRAATAWIVESDYSTPTWPNPQTAAQLGSNFVEEQSGAPSLVFLGRNVALGSGGTWSESGNSLHIGAIAPGNPAFASMQTTCNNVYSLVDVLYGHPDDTLSYQVFGWFSDSSDDPLANLQTGIDTATAIADLGWQLAAGTNVEGNAGWTLVYGALTQVPWSSTAQIQSGVPAVGNVSGAIGNTSVEALTALIATQSAGSNLDIDLLEAFQLNLVDVLDEPDGGAVLADAVHTSSFARTRGGYIWEIVDQPNTTVSISAEQLAYERQWLAELNRNQAARDELLRQLDSSRKQLHTLWWKQGLFNSNINVPGLTAAWLAAQMDPTQGPSDSFPTGSVAWQVLDLKAQIAALDGTLLPVGPSAQQLQTQIEAYSLLHNLPSSRVLKRASMPVFYEPNNPVILLAGASASGIAGGQPSPLCRITSQIASAFVCDNTTVNPVTSSIPAPSLSGLSGVPWLESSLLSTLQDEFFLMDSYNAPVIQKEYNLPLADIQSAMANSSSYSSYGVYPTGAITGWGNANPWHPLLLQYNAQYYPIPHGTDDAPTWMFDGEQYVWNGQNATTNNSLTVGLNGYIQLTTAAVFNMEARLQAYVQNSNLDPQTLAAFKALLAQIQNSDAWDLLSQRLDGFNAQLQLSNTGAYAAPTGSTTIKGLTLQELIGDVKSNPPNIGAGVSSVSLFQPWRAGQFVIENLQIIDEWGQSLYLITSSNYAYANLSLPPEMTPVIGSMPSADIPISGSAVLSMNPSAAVVNSPGVEVSIGGFGFSTSTVVLWNGEPLSTTYQSDTELRTTLSSTNLTAAGSLPVTIQGSDAPAFTFDVTVQPMITSVSPAILAAGMAVSNDVTLSVSGAGFGDASTVVWNGISLPSTAVSSSLVTAVLPAEFTASPVSIPVTVVTNGVTTNAINVDVVEGPAIASIVPAGIVAGAQHDTQLTITGVNFDPDTYINWNIGAKPSNPVALETSFVSSSQLTATVPATLTSAAGTVSISAINGFSVLPNSPDAIVQLSPGVLQPARLNFDLVSADNGQMAGLTPEGNPICGWVMPNHLDHSLDAYDADGHALGSLSIAFTAQNAAAIYWQEAPGSPYAAPLAEIAARVPHFGPFLQELSEQSPGAFRSFLAAIDETLWTTIPIGSNFNSSLASLAGRPLAMVRARLNFQVYGQTASDPSWQYTVNPAEPPLLSYWFPVKLGNSAQLEDGLIGYFLSDDYGSCNIVQTSGIETGNGYLNPIGVDGNYINLNFDGRLEPTYISMLVDPRAAVHATTAILPTVSVALAPELTDAALASIEMTFRVDGILADMQIPAPAPDLAAPATMLIPVPSPVGGSFQWLERSGEAWQTHPLAANDTTARLSTVPPVLRRGFLKWTPKPQSAASSARRPKPNRPIRGRP